MKPQNRWANALGGLDRLKQIENVYTRSAIEIGGLSGTVEEWQTAQGQYKQSVDLGGVYRFLTVFDGEKGWILDQNGKVRELAGTDLENEVTSTYLGSFSHLIPGRMSGRAENLGEDEAQQHDIVKLLPQGGRPVTCYLDKATYLPVKQEQPEADRTRTVHLSDWRDVDGVKIPFQMRQTTGDPKYDTVVTVQEVRFNVPLDETAFQKPQEAAPDFRFAAGQSAPGIPLELNNNHIYLQVQINNSEPLGFILDTGAAASVIDTRRAEALDLELQGELEGRGAGEGSTNVAIAKGVSFQLPGVELFDQTIAVISLESFESHEGRTIDGILGYDFISRFVVEIDYAAELIHLYDPQGYEYAGSGESLPITLEGNVPLLYAKVVQSERDPIDGKFLIDTGAGGTLGLNKPFIETHELLKSSQKTIQALFGMGVGGETKHHVGRLNNLQLGQFVIEDPVIGFSQDAKGALANPDLAGLLGGEILRRFRVIFDYARQQMILEPNATFAEPYEYDMSGTYLIAEGPAFKAFKVYRTLENAPASEAGLQQGDVITAIDDRPATEFTLNQVRQLLKQEEGREYLLSIERDEEPLQIQIRLRRLI
ncbi:MAG: aspartyl protease family protein [Candidatus Bipolaricaulia bacterium]